MIETKEQYEFLADVVPYGKEWRETIEALREVARAANLVINGKMAGKTVAEVRMKQAVASLPDWLTRE